MWLASTNSLLDPRQVEHLVVAGWTQAALHLDITIIVVTVGIVVWNVVDSLRKVGIDKAARAKRIGSSD